MPKAIRRARGLMLLAVLALLVAAPAAEASRGQLSIFDGGGLLLNDATRDATLDRIRAMGTNDIRVVLYWRSVAPDPDSPRRPRFDEDNPNAYAASGWAPYDRLLAAARARRLGVHLTITGPAPNWAHNKRTGPSHTRYRQFVEAVGRRYGSQPKTWSLWNEPNQQTFLSPQWRKRGRRWIAQAPKTYRRLYIEGRKGLRAAGLRREPILFGELAPRGGKSMTPLRFLREALCLNRNFRKTRAKCAKIVASDFAYHVYVTKGGPFQRSGRDRVNMNALPRLTTALTRAARAGRISGGLRLYITESGVVTKPRKDGAWLSDQATFMGAAERIAYQNRRVKAYSQYLLNDPPSDGSGGAFITGLAKSNGTPKPAYEAWRLPLVVYRSGSRAVKIWGLVRPARRARERARVTLEYRDRGKRWRRYKRLRTARSGYYSSRGSYRAGRQYRVKYEDITGATVKVIRWRSPQR